MFFKHYFTVSPAPQIHSFLALKIRTVNTRILNVLLHFYPRRILTVDLKRRNLYQTSIRRKRNYDKKWVSLFMRKFVNWPDPCRGRRPRGRTRRGSPPQPSACPRTTRSYSPLLFWSSKRGKNETRGAQLKTVSIRSVLEWFFFYGTVILVLQYFWTMPKWICFITVLHCICSSCNLFLFLMFQTRIEGGGGNWMCNNVFE